MTTWTLMSVVALLFAVAIGVQVYYLRGLQRAGIEINRATKVVVWVNIAMLALITIVLLVVTAMGGLPAVGT